MTFQEYLAARGAALVRIARLLTADDRRADILVRDVLARAYPRWNDIAKAERPDVYLRRMLVDRERWRRPSPLPAEGVDPTWRHIASRSRRERAALVLSYHEDLDDTVIAEILDTSPAAVRADRRRALSTGDRAGVHRSGIGASLRERTSAPVDVSALIAIATREGRARSRRRRTARWTATAAVVLAVAGAGLAAAAPRATDPPPRFDGIEPYFYADTRLPRAPGVPAAGRRPDLVGTDPAVLHFDAPALTNRARWHTWITGPGYEKLEAAIGPADVVYLTVGRDRQTLQAVAPEESLRTIATQRLSNGLWLRVEATSDEAMGAAKQAVNLTESQRCVLPYRVPVRPRDAAVTTCYVGFRSGHYAEGGLILRAGGRSLEVQAQYVPGFPNRKTANHQCGHRPAFLFPGGGEVEVLLGYNGFYLSARIGGPYQGYAVADADAMLAAVAIASNVEQISTWPASPINP